MKKKSMLIVAIILMSIGFAAISTTLVINGNAKVSENTDDFSVIFTAASLDGKDVYSTVVDDTKKIINFTTSELKTLNQTSVLNYEVTNNSSNYDAEVNVTCVPKEGIQAKYTSIKNKLENDATKVSAKSSVNGTLTITLDKTSTESIIEEYTCSLEFTATERDEVGEGPTQFEKDSWSTIAANVKAGNTDKYNIGDTKEVDLGSLGIHTVRVSNKSKCTNGETSETACGFVVEFADIITKHAMNSTPFTTDGWDASDARNYVNTTIFQNLPTDLQNIVADTKVISGSYNDSGANTTTSIDKLYLLSTKEIYGAVARDINDNHLVYDMVDIETKQLDYYKQEGVTMQNSTKALKQYNGSDSFWWLRSVANYAPSKMFLFVYDSNSDNSGFPAAVEPDSNSIGISPAFRIA